MTLTQLAQKHNLEPESAKAFYTRCGDCGRFVPRLLWVRRDHPKYTHALCHSCASGYECAHSY